MKKNCNKKTVFRILLVSMLNLVLCCTTLNGQTIERPKCNANTTGNRVSIYKVERLADQTIFTIYVDMYKYNDVIFSSKTFIIDSDGGTPLYIKSVEDQELDKVITSKKRSSSIMYKLYFPPLPSNTKKINFRSGENGSYWHFFDIDVTISIGISESIHSKAKGRDGNCRYVNSPGYTAKSKGFQITKIEMCDTATILHFKAHISSSGWILIPSESTIRDSKGGENFYVKSAIGASIGERLTIENTGKIDIEYKLFFPPIDESVKKIDFREINKKGGWYAYELDTDVE